MQMEKMKRKVTPPTQNPPSKWGERISWVNPSSHKKKKSFIKILQWCKSLLKGCQKDEGNLYKMRARNG